MVEKKIHQTSITTYFLTSKNVERNSENIKDRRYLPQIEDDCIFSLPSLKQRQNAETQFADCPANALKLLSFVKEFPCENKIHNSSFCENRNLWVWTQHKSFTKIKSFKAFAGQSTNWVFAFCRCCHDDNEKIWLSSICGKYRLPLIFSLILSKFF